MALPANTKELVLTGIAAGATAFGLWALFKNATSHTDAPAEDEEEVSTTSVSKGGHSLYETDKAVSEYLMFHFQDQNTAFCPYDCAPPHLDFAKRTAEICCDLFKSSGTKPLRALDVGCAVGRSSLEMTKVFSEVVGVDFSHKFIDAAKRLIASPTGLSYSFTEEGVTKSSGTARVPAGTVPSKCTFVQGDACALDTAALGQFHIVHAANLLCRLPDPRAFLRSLPALVAAGGRVVFISPYSWLKQYTPPANWLGGYRDADGKAVDSFATLQREMEALGFELESQGNEPFVIREHRRKFQWGCSHLTIWRKA